MTESNSVGSPQSSPQSNSAIGVVGSGTMGSGIAQVAAQQGYAVLLYDISDEIVSRAVARLQATLDKLAAKGKISVEDASAAMGRIQPTSRLEDLAAASFIIEAAPEDIPLKQDLFRRLDVACPPATIIASNTSSLSITMLGGGRPSGPRGWWGCTSSIPCR